MSVLSHLNHDWRTLHATRATPASWRHSPLSHYPTLGDILTAACSAPEPQQDEILTHLILRAQDNDPTATRVLVQRFLPRAINTSRTWADDDAYQTSLQALLEAIHALPLATKPHLRRRLGTRISLDLLSYYTRLCRYRREDHTTLPTESRVVEWIVDRTGPHTDLEDDIATRLDQLTLTHRVTTMLDWAVTHRVITTRDRRILLATEQLHDLTPAAQRQARRRALHKLSTALTVGTMTTWLEPCHALVA